MGRGDVVIVAAPGDYGKPRPAIIVQSSAIPEGHSSVVICPMTSEIADADFRVTIEPAPETGLHVRSQIMADKPVTVRRERIGQRIGRAMLDHLLEVARDRGFVRVSLETGTTPAFAPARTLYQSAGFVPCGPFGGDQASADNTFMTLDLGATR